MSSFTLTFIFFILISLLSLSITLNPSAFAQYVEDEIIVKFYEDATEQTIKEIIAECETKIIDEMSSIQNLFLVKIQEQKTVRETVNCFVNFENVKYAEPNFLVSIANETSKSVAEKKKEYEEKVSIIRNLDSKPSPKKQMVQGLFPHDVICSNDLVLILKLNQNKSACVSMKNVDKLVERGWGILASETFISDPFDECSDSITLQYGQKDSDSKIMKKLRMELGEKHLFKENYVWFPIHILESDDGKTVTFNLTKLKLEDRSVLKNTLEKFDEISNVQILNPCE